MSSSQPCIICDHDKTEILSCRDRSGNPLHNVICCYCGLVWVYPRPDTNTLKSFYATDYRLQYKNTWHPRPKHVYRDTLGAVERARRVLEVYREGMKVLDVGSGAGFFLLVLEKLSIDAAGLEPNLGYTEFAREELQLHNIFNGVLTEFNSNLTYDIITINHVFEHLDDPSAALQKMGSLLTANGCIIMEIPNIESTYHAPNNIFHSGHLFWYNPVNIEALILKAGFTITDRKVPAGTGHINLIIKKQTTDIPDAAVDLNVLLEGNYDRVKNIRDRHTLIRHYTSPVPYLRFLRKGMQYAREIYHTCNADSCLGIAETICDSKLPGLRTAFRADETNQAPG